MLRPSHQQQLLLLRCAAAAALAAALLPAAQGLRLRGTEGIDGVPLTDVARIQGKDGRCLNFLHIPKTAGSSLEETFHLAVQESPLQTHNMKGWGREDSSLACERPKSLPWGSGCAVLGPKFSEFACAKWHVPPAWDAHLEKSYSSCTTFCVVRDPVRRMISEAGFRHANCQRPLGLDHWLNRSLRAFGADPSYLDCHFVPQYEYVYGGLTMLDGWAPGRPGTYCQRVLRFENLAWDFEKLMREFNFPLSLTLHDGKSECQATPAPETVKLIEEVYREDYEAFGFPRAA